MKFLFLLLLAGCVAPASKINAVSIGMTKAEVLKVMGHPVSVTADKDAEYLNYSLSEQGTATMAPQTPYAVKLVNGRVESYGRAGSATVQRQPPGIILPVR